MDKTRIIDRDIESLSNVGTYEALGPAAVKSLERVCDMISRYERWLHEACRRAEYDWERNEAGKYDRGFWDAIEMADDQFGGMMEGRP